MNLFYSGISRDEKPIRMDGRNVKPHMDGYPERAVWMWGYDWIWLFWFVRREQIEKGDSWIGLRVANFREGEHQLYCEEPFWVRSRYSQHRPVYSSHRELSFIGIVLVPELPNRGEMRHGWPSDRIDIIHNRYRGNLGDQPIYSVAHFCRNLDAIDVRDAASRPAYASICFSPFFCFFIVRAQAPLMATFFGWWRPDFFFVGFN